MSVFSKFLRWFTALLIIATLVFCVLFALLQSKWIKEKIRQKIISGFEEAGIPVHISGIEGELPFTWTLKEMEICLSENQEIALSDLKFRIAIFPLLKGRLVISYFKAGAADIFFLEPEKPSKPLTFSEAKQALRAQLEKMTLPLQVNINHFFIERLNFVDRASGASFHCAAAGKVKLQKQLREFAIDLNFFSLGYERTYFKASLIGSAKKGFIASEFKVDIDTIPAFLSLGVSGALNAELFLKGPWGSFQKILYDEPLTEGPLDGLIKGAITHTNVVGAPLFNRDWKFKTRFSLTSGRAALVQNMLLLSNLVHLKGKAELSDSFERTKAVFCFSTPNLALFSPFAPAHLEGTATGKAVFQEGIFKGSFQTRDLLVDTFAARSVRGFLKGSLDGEEWEAEAKLSSSNADLPFEASCALDFVPNKQLSIINLNVASHDLNVHGYLDYLVADHLFEGSFFANVEHLDWIGAFFKEEILDGKLAAEVVLTANDGEQNARCALVGKNMRYRDYLMDDLTLSAEMENLFQEPMGRINVLAEKVYTPTFYLDRLTFGTKSDEVQWPFFLKCQGRIENPFELDARGFCELTDSLRSLELTELSGHLSHTPFSLKYPFEIEWGTDYFNVSPIDFRMGKGSLYTAFELSPVRSLGKWEIKHFPLEILSCLKPRFALSGFVSASGYLDATKENCEGVLNATIEEANVLHFGKKEPVRTRGTVQAHINNQIMQVHTALFASDNQFLDLNGTLPLVHQPYPLKFNLDKTKNTSAELIAEGKIQDLFDFVNLGTNYFTGLFSCRLFLSQTLSNPSLQGQIELHNGSFENYFTGIHLRHIDASFEAMNNEIKLVALEAGDEKAGEVSMTGKIALEPAKNFPYAFEAEMHNLHAVGFDMIDCNLSGPLYLTGTTKSMLAQGNLLVDSSTIQINERLPYEIPTLPATFVNIPKHLMSAEMAQPSRFDFNIDLEVTSEGTVHVEGRGLNAELEGNVHVRGKNTQITASGDLKLIKGEYAFSGKIFKLTEGEIIFKDKPAPSAYLSLNGTLNLPGVIVTAMLRGPLAAPQLSFQSNPQKPTSSILALILFNKDISDISQPEAIQLASTLVSLSGGAGPDVLESIRKSIGIDRLNIASKPGSDELAVQIGKYLTRGIMITLSQSATSSQVIVEVELPKGFVFTAETQEEQEGKFSLKWRKTY